MAKKSGSSGGGMMCPGCGKHPCCCDGNWCTVVGGLVFAVAGLLMVWPYGWFTPWRVLGVLTFLFGLKLLFWGFKK